MSTTDWNTSGRINAHQAAVGPPQSWPTTHATLLDAESARKSQHIADAIHHGVGQEIVVEFDGDGYAAPVTA